MTSHLQDRIETALAEVERRGYRLTFDAISRMLLAACEWLECDPHAIDAEIEIHLSSSDYRESHYSVLMGEYALLFDYMFRLFSIIPINRYEKESKPMNDLLTVSEVAQVLRVDDTTVRRWIKQGALAAIILPHVNARQAYRVRRSTLDDLVNTPAVEKDARDGNQAVRR